MLFQTTHQSPRTALTIFAHPDDAEISSFGFLSKLRKQGWRVVVLIVTRGENGADPSEWDRRLEAEAAAGLIGAELVFGDFPDGFVARNSELISWLERVLDRERPEVIVTHHVGESRTAHQDHVAVEAAVQIAVRRADWTPTLLLAEGPDNDATFRPNWFVDITDEFETKLAAIGLHLSQGRKYYMQPDYHELRSRRWGLSVLAGRERPGIKAYWEAYFLAQQVN
ncbi:PIG-L deacetylase family protein [uncultured Paracoccus sp.]|uniref:PIG-L deacetylase family protein n=1 Tax=uncultured Paracoccus sp. TaxID=189685 RepID=UPI00261BC221|nr:PIG-L deacetylase family protein [uncultured Paracoccus sp.]